MHNKWLATPFVGLSTKWIMTLSQTTCRDLERLLWSSLHQSFLMRANPLQQAVGSQHWKEESPFWFFSYSLEYGEENVWENWARSTSKKALGQGAWFPYLAVPWLLSLDSGAFKVSFSVLNLAFHRGHNIPLKIKYTLTHTTKRKPCKMFLIFPAEVGGATSF